MYYRSLTLSFFVVMFFIATTGNAQKTIKTEVFTLSTCDPTGFSFIKTLPPGASKKARVDRLESRSNKLSALRITGINPLRYKYFINNQAVTQFMEATPLTLSINTFANPDYLLTAPEIKVPEIFKTDSISSDTRAKIRDFQHLNKRYNDSIEAVSSTLQGLWNSFQPSDINLERKSKKYYKEKTIIKINNIMDSIRSLHDRNLRDYQIYISELPINNKEFEILRQYRTDDTTRHIEEAIDSIRSFEKNFASQYCNNIDSFKKIDSLLAILDTIQVPKPVVLNGNSTFQVLMNMLRFYNFNWPEKQYNYYTITDAIYINDNINLIKEQILNKQFQLYQEFILSLATKIGVLVQNQFREYSSFDNALRNYNCIDADTVRLVKAYKEKLIKTFEFIQKTSAELQIMVSYLDINTALYESIAKKINTNYVFLLSYLKNLQYVIRENTLQYTLPTSTNSANVDLIRYAVRREDKITGSSQTYNYDLWLRGGLKIDFSVGFFGTRLTDNVYNKVLLDTTGGIDSIRITRQDDGRTNFAFGGMVNITRRNGASWLNYGGSIGVAYSGNQKLQVLAGLSLHFGKTERLIVHGGAAFGTIKYLDVSANDFKFFDRELNPKTRETVGEVKEKDRVYMLHSPDVKFSSYTVPTVERFVVRPFVGISYNLSKKNALQAVSGTGGVQTFSDNFKTGVSY